jgi:hypothetical protein
MNDQYGVERNESKAPAVLRAYRIAANVPKPLQGTTNGPFWFVAGNKTKAPQPVRGSRFGARPRGRTNRGNDI